MARKGPLKAIYRYVSDAVVDDEIEWTFIFDDEGSLDVKFDGSMQWDPNGDIDFSEDDDWEQIWLQL